MQRMRLARLSWFALLFGAWQRPAHGLALFFYHPGALCSGCSAGAYSPITGSSVPCSPWPAGTYSTATGATKCYVCAQRPPSLNASASASASASAAPAAAAAAAAAAQSVSSALLHTTTRTPRRGWSRWRRQRAGDICLHRMLGGRVCRPGPRGDPDKDILKKSRVFKPKR